MPIKTKSPSFQPLYAQVKELMTRRLINNDWKAGMALPSENQLAKEFKVSQGTVRKALDEMTAENLMVRQQGRGTFIAEHTLQRALFHFLHIVGEDDNRQLPKSKVTSIELGSADELESQHLQLKNSDQVIRISRTRFLNEQPVIDETISIPSNLFPELGQQKEKIPNTLYSLYEQKYGISVARATERLSAESCQEEAAERLNLPLGSPLLCIQRIAYTLNSQPVELRISRCNTLQHHYLSELT